MTRATTNEKADLQLKEDSRIQSRDRQNRFVTFPIGQSKIGYSSYTLT